MITKYEKLIVVADETLFGVLMNNVQIRAVIRKRIPHVYWLELQNQSPIPGEAMSRYAQRWAGAVMALHNAYVRAGGYSRVFWRYCNQHRRQSRL